MPAAAVLTWKGDPVLLEVGPIAIRWYGVLFATGFALGFLQVKRAFQREGKPLADLDRLLVTLIVSTVIGARLGHVLFYHAEYYFENPIRILQIWKGGLASHGGAVGVLVGLWLYSRSRPEQPFLWLIDRNAAPVALTGCLIRIGNFFNSEIVGVPSDLPWAIVFERFDDTPRHPAQLYESASYLGIFGVLFLLDRKRGTTLPRGLLAGLFLVLVFSARFLIEFVKRRQADFAQDWLLSMGQILSIAFILGGAALIAFAVSRGRPAGASGRS